ncbi:hypothetical protein MKW92_049618 [Papaver armeniacum]|nr:hypothetical protein MKW92_049618 [Papaver armeniacum]
MVVKIYGPGSGACPQRVMVETIRLELGEHKRPEFLVKQPFGQVPVVEDGDFRLFESRAIIRYYVTKYADQGTNLLGKTLEERALVDQWLEVEAHNFNVIYTIVFQVVILPRMEKLGKVLDIYEEQLSKNKLSFRRLIRPRRLGHLQGIQDLMNEAGKGYLVKDRKNVNAWWEDISNRPAWKKVRNSWRKLVEARFKYYESFLYIIRKTD